MGVIETFHEGRLSHIVIICTHCLQNPASGRKHLISNHKPLNKTNKGKRRVVGCLYSHNFCCVLRTVWWQSSRCPLRSTCTCP